MGYDAAAAQSNLAERCILEQIAALQNYHSMASGREPIRKSPLQLFGDFLHVIINLRADTLIVWEFSYTPNMSTHAFIHLCGRSHSRGRICHYNPPGKMVTTV